MFDAGELLQGILGSMWLFTTTPMVPLPVFGTVSLGSLFLALVVVPSLLGTLLRRLARGARRLEAEQRDPATRIRKASAARGLAPLPEGSPGPCPRCGRPLVPRDGRRGPFTGCSGFPSCRYTRDA